MKNAFLGTLVSMLLSASTANAFTNTSTIVDLRAEIAVAERVFAAKRARLACHPSFRSTPTRCQTVADEYNRVKREFKLTYYNIGEREKTPYGSIRNAYNRAVARLAELLSAQSSTDLVPSITAEEIQDIVDDPNIDWLPANQRPVIAPAVSSQGSNGSASSPASNGSIGVYDIVWGPASHGESVVQTLLEEAGATRNYSVKTYDGVYFFLTPGQQLPVSGDYAGGLAYYADNNDGLNVYTASIGAPFVQSIGVESGRSYLGQHNFLTYHAHVDFLIWLNTKDTVWIQAMANLEDMDPIPLAGGNQVCGSTVGCGNLATSAIGSGQAQAMMLACTISSNGEAACPIDANSPYLEHTVFSYGNVSGAPTGALSGNSYAAPRLAHLVKLLRINNPHLSAAQIKQLFFTQHTEMRTVRVQNRDPGVFENIRVRVVNTVPNVQPKANPDEE